MCLDAQQHFSKTAKPYALQVSSYQGTDATKGISQKVAIKLNNFDLRYGIASIMMIHSILKQFDFNFRNHPLARECDIVETLHMRLTLLQMTFGKHIERKHVCFFAGEVSFTVD